MTTRGYAQEIAFLLIVIVGYGHLAYALRRSQDRSIAAEADDQL